MRRVLHGGLGVALLVGLGACGGSEGEAEGAAESTQGDGSGDDTGSAIAPDPELCAPISAPVLDQPGAQQLELVASRDQIPGLASQPTLHGQILGTLFAFDGRVHLGYGDYSDNTGPIPATAWDPAQAAFVDLGVLPTEEVLWFRPGPGVLYSPAIDPDGHEEDGGIYRLDCGSAAWQVGTPIEGAVHVYDVAVQGETIFAGTGSLTDAPARLMTSTDYGTTWEELVRHESPPGHYSRIYYLGATSAVLFASGREHPEPGEIFGWVRYGTSDPVRLVDPPGGALVPLVHGDELLVVGFTGNPGRANAVSTYRLQGDRLEAYDLWAPLGDGTLPLVAWTTMPAQGGHPERLHVLMRSDAGSYAVHRTERLLDGAWQNVGVIEAPPDGDAYVSMALFGEDLYLGTRAGSLYVVRELYAPAE